MLVVFAVAVTLPSVQVPARLGGVAMTSPPGSVSVNVALRVAADVLPLLSVSVSCEGALTTTVVGLKLLLTPGGPSTVNVAAAGATLLTPWVVASAPAGIVLI